MPKARIARDLGCSRRVLYEALAALGVYAGPVPAEEQVLGLVMIVAVG